MYFDIFEHTSPSYTQLYHNKREKSTQRHGLVLIINTHLKNLGNSAKLGSELTTILSQFNKDAESDYIQEKAKDSITLALKGYSNEIIEGAVATAKLSEAGADAVYSIAGFGEEAKATALRMTVLTNSEGEAIEKTSDLVTAFAGLKAMIAPLIKPLGYVAGALAIIAIIDALNVTANEQIEKNRELADSYNESLSKIRETESELSQVKSRMSELQNMGRQTLQRAKTDRETGC